jgi:hypothetical protein
VKGSSTATTADEYIASLEEPRKSEIQRLDRIIREVAPELEPGFGSGMLGYGLFHYEYATGREGDAYKIGLSSRKDYISLYCLATNAGGYVAEQYKERLPKASIGKSCVRFKRVDDLDEAALRELIATTAKTPYG